ncbi:mur ligase central [Lucifera butyrica]|uniref:UDP-N-acetylmuramoylalanine--D-glutamate ligase n=1 Tax=Lucifera butyrica TaxID=1351585 RepID=A0A498R467_9FIRM|nr:UDP-N-acetylmuramoyl-L-alanine--D-glutamate ligase [Lucifera butyrica]VBB06221.1 mur ligase central [Lucifera butyrica]
MIFKEKRFVVLGAGVSGISAAKTLRELGARVTLSDKKRPDILTPAMSALKETGVVLALGQQDETLLQDIDYLVLSPGVSVYNPLVQAAQARGISVVSEIEVAYQLCRAPMIAITGTNGKTTTTTLVGEMLQQAGRQVVVGGNIGLALSQEVKAVDESGIVVAEISSFQLEAVDQFKPHIAAVLNITPDHIDRHGSMETYIAMKERVFSRQMPEDYAVLNYDDGIVRSMAERTASQVMFFSRQVELPEGVFVKNENLTIRWRGAEHEVCSLNELKIRGNHNVENALAACGISYLAGLKTAVMAAVLKAFPGVEHRIEPVGTINGVEYYNDSKATNPESAMKALEAFAGHIILIAGGRDKKTDLAPFMHLIQEKVDTLILLGEAKERFREAAKKQGIGDIRESATMAEALETAHSIARAPQVVLLSPACASYDMFRNYEERGRVFKELIRGLS